MPVSSLPSGEGCGLPALHMAKAPSQIPDSENVSSSSGPPTCNVFHVDFYAGSFPAAAELVTARALSGAGGYVTLTGVHGIVEAQHDALFRRALEDAWLNFPDGVPVTWAQRSLCEAEAERVCGPDLLPFMVSTGRAVGLRHYLFGSSEAVLSQLRSRLVQRSPGSLIVGSEAPPFGPIHLDDTSASVERIRASVPHVVWVGLGAPKQELWMQRHAAVLAPALLIGAGAAFDMVAGVQPRAPAAMQRSGLEWLYRLAHEPRRLAGRYARANSEFLLRFALEFGAARARLWSRAITDRNGSGRRSR
jgi:N-acetylglucosaminyldiphosphoundecaprenol N-acetyl-beta-D-mannosaminyltransferase